VIATSLWLSFILASSIGSPPTGCVDVPGDAHPLLALSAALEVAAAAERVAATTVQVDEVRRAIYVRNELELGGLGPDLDAQPRFPSWLLLARGQFTLKRGKTTDHANRAIIFVAESPPQAYAIRFANDPLCLFGRHVPTLRPCAPRWLEPPCS
jgi:hypothetical protein